MLFHNKTILSLSLILNIGLLSAVAYCIYKKPNTPIKQFSVAIFEPAVHPAIEEITQEFTSSLNTLSTDAVRTSVFNANGNKSLLRAQAEEIIAGNFDAIFTIGASCTQTMYELSNKKKSETPIIFGAVDDPVGMGIVSSLEHSNNNLTGVIEESNYQQQIDFLLQLAPNVRSVGLVYDPAHGTGLDKDADTLTAILAEKNVNLMRIAVNYASDIANKVPALLTSIDALLVLKDNTVVAGIDALVKLANQNNITLYASDLNSGMKGAALAYGIKERDTGVHAAHKALKVLSGTRPTDIPTTPVSPLYLQINIDTARKQNLDISDEMIRLISVGTVYPREIS